MHTSVQVVVRLFFLLVVFAIPKVLFATIPAEVTSPYLYNFNSEGVLKEAGNLSESSSRYWWVNSGGSLIIKNGRGSTLSGNLPTTDPFRILYAANNPTDTDNGYHPQNIFRLITASKWQNAIEEAYFVIKKDNLSKSVNRNQSNGILLFSRYQNSNSLYYTGVRVDGSAIIKKKLNGIYYTLAEKKFWEGNVYDREENPIVLPKNVWIGIKSEVRNIAPNKVMIEMFVDIGKTGTWTSVMEVLDDGTIGGNTLSNKGFAGIRTDFMDVEFSDYLNVEI